MASFVFCSLLHTKLNQFRTSFQGIQAHSPLSEKYAQCVSLNWSQAVTGRQMKPQTVYSEMLFAVVNVVKGQSGSSGTTLPVGENFAVIVHLNLQHLVSIQSAGNRPSKYLEKKREYNVFRRL